MFLRKFLILFFFGIAFTLPSPAQYNFNKYLSDAKEELVKNNYPEAINKLNVCIQVRPAEYQAWFYRGVCKYYLNDNLGALSDLEMATSNYSAWFYDACTYRALVKDRLEDYDGAIKDFNLVLSKKPDDPQLYIQRSFSRLSNRDYTGALRDCNTALGLHGISEELYLCKGAAETELGDYENAWKDFDRALEINPRNQNAYVRRGLAKYKAGRTADAIEDYNTALKIDSGCTFAYYNRAAARIDSKDYKGAIRDYEALLRYEPTNALTWYNKAVLEANRNEYRRALEDFNHVLVLNPENIQALLNRAKVKQSLNDTRGAYADYDKAIELFPYFTEAYYERSLLKKSTGDFAGAQKDYDLGKMMSDLNHAKKENQVARDSVLLSRLTDLNADFNNVNSVDADTVSIGMLPIYHLDVKDSTAANASENMPVLFKKSKRDYSSFHLTMNDIATGTSTNSGFGTLAAPGEASAEREQDSLLCQAVQHTNMQLYNDAAKEFERIIERDSSCTIAWFARGINACKQVELLNKFDDELLLPGQPKKIVTNQKEEIYRQALSDFNRTIQAEPQFAIAYYNRAFVKCQLHDFNGAIKDYDRAVASDLNLASAFYNRGLFLYYLKDKLNACRDFSKAGELGLADSYAVIKKYCLRNVEK